MDSADEQWINSQPKGLSIDILKFEQMMDRLEKSSSQTVVTLNEAKALLKEDDDITMAVYDYWLTKRLKTVFSQNVCKKSIQLNLITIFLATSIDFVRENRKSGQYDAE